MQNAYIFLENVSLPYDIRTTSEQKRLGYLLYVAVGQPSRMRSKRLRDSQYVNFINRFGDDGLL